MEDSDHIGPTNSAFLSYFKQVLPLVAPTPSSHMLQFVPNVGKKTNLASGGETRKVTTDGIRGGECELFIEFIS